MALECRLPLDSNLQMDLVTARHHLALERNGRFRSLDSQVLPLKDISLFGYVKPKLFHETITERALLTVCAKNSAPFERAGKRAKEKFMESSQPRLSTGFAALDKQLAGGIHSRTITQVLGPEAAGKSAFVHHFMRHHLEANSGCTIVYVSPIDDAAILLKRVASV